MKFLVILLVAATVIAQDSNIDEYQLAIGSEGGNFNPGPFLLHLRPRRQAKEDKDRGSVGADVSRGPDGTRVSSDADYNIHTSRDGRTTVDGQAAWETTYNCIQNKITITKIFPFILLDQHNYFSYPHSTGFSS